MKTTKLHVVGEAKGHPKPPRKLKAAGGALWRAVNEEYSIADIGGIELLALACETLDRADSCREAIDRDGELIRTKAGTIREHPLLKAELACRAFVARTIQRLGLDVEALRSAQGRPGTPIGWTG